MVVLVGLTDVREEMAALRLDERIDEVTVCVDVWWTMIVEVEVDRLAVEVEVEAELELDSAKGALLEDDNVDVGRSE